MNWAEITKAKDSVKIKKTPTPRKKVRIFISFSREEQFCATPKLSLSPNHVENTFATADCSARAISAHSSEEIVKGGARRI